MSGGGASFALEDLNLSRTFAGIVAGDAVTMPTPIGVQEAVAPGAAYTSRVLWRWVKTRYDLWASLSKELP